MQQQPRYALSSWRAVCLSAATLCLMFTATAQSEYPFEYPCNQWVDRVVNGDAPYGDTHYGGVLYGFEKIIYMDGSGHPDPNHKQITNIYGANYQHWGHLNTSSVDMDFYSDIESHNGRLYYKGVDEKFHVATWNGSSWVMNPVNNDAIDCFEGFFEIDNTGRIFYNGSDRKVYNIMGPNWWEWGPLNTSAPSSSGGIELGGGSRIYFLDYDFNVMYYYWTGSQWLWDQANVHAVNARRYSELIYDNGRILYVGEDDLIRYIDGPGAGQHGVLLPGAPAVTSTLISDMILDNNKLVYTSESDRFHMIYEVNNNLFHTQIHPTAEPSSYANIDFVDGRGIVYVNRDRKVHELVYYPCYDEPIGEPDPGGPGAEKFGQTAPMVNSSVQVSLFPSPVVDKVSVDVSGEFTNGLVEIFDAQGRLVKSAKVQQNEPASLRMVDEPAGVYWLRFSSSEGMESHKFMKQ